MKKRGAERCRQASGLRSVTDQTISARWASLTYPAETLKKSLKIARDRQDTSSSSHVFFSSTKTVRLLFSAL